jgi:flavin-dependent dehydrogenase
VGRHAGLASWFTAASNTLGIAVGLAQARAAVAAVVTGDLGRYERDWRRVTWRHDLLTHGLLAATRHRTLRTRIVPAAAAMPRVFEAAVNQLARPA